MDDQDSGGYVKDPNNPEKWIWKPGPGGYVKDQNNPEKWIWKPDQCGQDLEKFVKQCLPKYSPRTSIETITGKKGYIDSVSWSKENKCWMYEYSYGLYGSEGYIKESDIKLNK